jgi:hypothetical protein
VGRRAHAFIIPRTKRAMREPLDDVSTAVGNLLRIALVIEVDEAAAACELADVAPLDTQLLDPRRDACTPHDHELNRRLLGAFARFRWELEAIRLDAASENRRR